MNYRNISVKAVTSGKEIFNRFNAIIDFFKGTLPENGINFLSGIEPIISIITFIEVFSNAKADEKEVEELQNFWNVATVYKVDVEVALVTVELRKKYKVKLPDALIAATALTYGLTLITRDTSDFMKIEHLEIINPHLI